MRLTDFLVPLRQFNCSLCAKNPAPLSDSVPTVQCRDVMKLKGGGKNQYLTVKNMLQQSSREGRVDERSDYSLKQGRVDICYSFRFKYSWKQCLFMSEQRVTT